MKTLYRTGKIRKDRRPALSDAERKSLPFGGPIIRNATCDRCGQLRPAVVVLGCARICRQCQDNSPPLGNNPQPSTSAETGLRQPAAGELTKTNNTK